MDEWWKKGASARDQILFGVYGARRGTGANNIDTSAESLFEMIDSRMRWGGKSPFETIHCHKRDEEVFVFIVGKTGEPVTLTDEWGLFPSDKLITAIRIIKD